MEMTIPKTQIDYSKLKKKKFIFRKNAQIRPIYHYTSIGGLQGIFESKTLRFTNIKYMNDKDEIVAGLDSMAKDCNATEVEREKLISAFTNKGSQTFVCCFSLEEDSLSMWNYYTKEINNQGYNIEFDVKKLVESILRNNPILDGCYLAFGNVDYSKNDDSEYSRKIITYILSAMKVSFSKLFFTVANDGLLNPSKSISERNLSDWEIAISNEEKKLKYSEVPIYFYNGEKCSFEKNMSADYLYFIKRDCFKQEKEFRIVITIPDEILPKLKEKSVYKFRVSNGVLVPYIELKFTEDAVKSVTISPTVQSDLVELSIQDFMKYCKYDIKDISEFIKHSGVPVRF